MINFVNPEKKVCGNLKLSHRINFGNNFSEGRITIFMNKAKVWHIKIDYFRFSVITQQ